MILLNIITVINIHGLQCFRAFRVATGQLAAGHVEEENQEEEEEEQEEQEEEEEEEEEEETYEEVYDDEKED